MKYERRAFYHETDKMGVIHHSNYLRWLEEARIYFLDQIGLSYRQMEEIGIISPVVSIKLDYKKPVLFDDVVDIYITVLKYTGVKLILSYEIRNKENNDLCVYAESSHCFIKASNVISLKKEYPEFDQKFRDFIEL